MLEPLVTLKGVQTCGGPDSAAAHVVVAVILHWTEDLGKAALDKLKQLPSRSCCLFYCMFVHASTSCALIYYSPMQTSNQQRQPASLEHTQ